MRRALVLVLALALAFAHAIGCYDWTLPPLGVAEAGSGADAGDAASSCTSDAGPSMVAFAGPRGAVLCIDATEVTQAQYGVFLAARGGDVAGQVDTCTSNVTFAPGCPGFDPAVHPALPVACVDWCDAYAFCRWANKRLCGDIDGGASTASADVRQCARTDQWVRACSHNDDGLHAYPYGNTFEASRCNEEADATAPVASKAGCVGGFPGLFDMRGNVAEWVDSCKPGYCAIHGGFAEQGISNLDCCGAQAFPPREDFHKDLGFRCCRIEP